jgi:hypothetical protein
MGYSAEISRTNPTAFVFLVDQSGSMEASFGGESGKTKSEFVADAINRLLQTLVLRCSKNEGIRDYFHVGVVGYGETVGPALGGSLAGRPLVPISEIAKNPLRIEQRTKKVDDGAGGLLTQTVKFPIWFEPLGGGTTPMREALEQAGQVVSDFVQQAPRAFAPIVLNLTDGEADADPEPVAASLRGLATEDGNVLLFNLHISSRNDPPIHFPASEGNLGDDYAKTLFRMSSVLPAMTQDVARKQGFQVSETSRGFVFNADPVSVVQFLDIGTRTDRNMR